MNKQKFKLWMASIDNKYLEEAACIPEKKLRFRYTMLAIAVCLVLASIGVLLHQGILTNEQSNHESYLANNSPTEAIAPETTPPDGITREYFAKDNSKYTLLSCEVSEPTDISGIESDTPPLVWLADSIEIKLCSTSDTAWASWFDSSTNNQWCLLSNTSSLNLLTTAADIMNELGYNIAVAPEAATDITYNAFLLNDLTVSETTFVLDGSRYSYRMAATYEVSEDFADISGITIAYDNILHTEVGWCPAKLSYTENETGKIIWFDIVPGLLYSLSMENAATEEALLSMAHSLFTPAQDKADW